VCSSVIPVDTNCLLSAHML